MKPKNCLNDARLFIRLALSQMSNVSPADAEGNQQHMDNCLYKASKALNEALEELLTARNLAKD